MRTTLTLDDDIAKRIDHAARRGGKLRVFDGLFLVTRIGIDPGVGIPGPQGLIGPGEFSVLAGQRLQLVGELLRFRFRHRSFGRTSLPLEPFDQGCGGLFRFGQAIELFQAGSTLNLSHPSSQSFQQS